MKTLIAVPSTDYMHAEFVKSLTALLVRLKNDGVNVDLCIENGTLVYMARDKLACKAINEGYDFVLWLDSDMVFTDEVLYDLQFSGKTFVTGLAVSRRKPFSACVFKSVTPDKGGEKFGDVDTMPRNTFEIAACGFACVLISTEVLKAVQLKHHTCFRPYYGYGEDIAFCMRARELGYKIYAEPAVKVGHIGHITIYPDDAVKYRDEWQRG